MFQYLFWPAMFLDCWGNFLSSAILYATLVVILLAKRSCFHSIPKAGKPRHQACAVSGVMLSVLSPVPIRKSRLGVIETSTCEHESKREKKKHRLEVPFNKKLCGHNKNCWEICILGMKHDSCVKISMQRANQPSLSGYSPPHHCLIIHPVIGESDLNCTLPHSFLSKLESALTNFEYVCAYKYKYICIYIYIYLFIYIYLCG